MQHALHVCGRQSRRINSCLDGTILKWAWKKHLLTMWTIFVLGWGGVHKWTEFSDTAERLHWICSMVVVDFTVQKAYIYIYTHVCICAFICGCCPTFLSEKESFFKEKVRTHNHYAVSVRPSLCFNFQTTWLRCSPTILPCGGWKGGLNLNLYIT